MKKLYIVANWKSNKNSSEAIEWFDVFKIHELEFTNKEIIICPSFTLLPVLKSSISNHKSAIKLGAQNISPFEEGSYTGEVNGKQIKEFADYVIIGHSERRSNFSEDDFVLANKVNQARKNNLTPIFCVQGKEAKVPDNVDVILYEPITAIGTGNPDTPQNAEEVASSLKTTYKIKYVLYGGSVDEKNVKEFTNMSNIDGVAVGTASLDPLEFIEICKNA